MEDLVLDLKRFKQFFTEESACFLGNYFGGENVLLRIGIRRVRNLASSAIISIYSQLYMLQKIRSDISLTFILFFMACRCINLIRNLLQILLLFLEDQTQKNPFLFFCQNTF